MAITAEKAYEELVTRCREVHTLGACEALLYWDERTYMPRGGAEGRSRQAALVSGMVHEKFTSPRIGELLSIVEGSSLVANPESDEAVNVRELRRDYDKQAKLPKDLVEELARVTSLAQGIWGEAREKSDFSHFLPILKEVIALKFRQAEAYGYETEPYDALIDDYELNTTCDDISKVFSSLRDELVPLVHAIVESGNRPNMSIIENDFPVDLQEKFGKETSAAIGFDYKAGRIDVSTHPFTTQIGPGDVRITTRFNPKHSDSRFLEPCMRRDTACTNRGFRRSISARRWPNRFRSASMNRNRECGRTWSEEACRFGSIFIPKRSRHSLR